MLRLFGSGASRWVKPYWLLRELKVPFEPVIVKLSTGEHKAQSYLRLNPFAKVPALEDGDFVLYESAAICNYLGEKFREGGLLPQGRDRAIYDQWISFITTELEQPLWRIIKHRYIYQESERLPAELELAARDFRKLSATLNELLPQDYLVGGRFSIADIAMAYTLKWATLPSLGVKLLDDAPKLSEYLDRLTSRPDFPSELYPQARSS